jgi:hypothetical protein
VTYLILGEKGIANSSDEHHSNQERDDWSGWKRRHGCRFGRPRTIMIIESLALLAFRLSKV